MIPAIDILEDVPLAPRTTLELGGDAQFYLRARDERAVADGLTWARRRGVKVGILGGGSNLIVPDEGFEGLVIEMAQAGIEHKDEGARVLVTAAAGEDWDLFVARTVREGLAGLECLSGIPGRVGATPIQNVGAYGQEVSETIVAVRALDRVTMQTVLRSPEECAFAYRDSDFKRDPSRYVVLAVTFALRPDGPPALRYAELTRAVADLESPSLGEVRDAVLALRRAKSMVLDELDENRRSAGSFFTNPIVDREVAARVVAIALAEGLVATEDAVPRWPAGDASGDNKVKLAAGWLVERAGLTKGTRSGSIGLSTRHALALVHHGDGTTRELLAFSQRVQDAVRARFGVELEREPVLFA